MTYATVLHTWHPRDRTGQAQDFVRGQRLRLGLDQLRRGSNRVEILFISAPRARALCATRTSAWTATSLRSRRDKAGGGLLPAGAGLGDLVRRAAGQVERKGLDVGDLAADRLLKGAPDPGDCAGRRRCRSARRLSSRPRAGSWARRGRPGRSALPGRCGRSPTSTRLSGSCGSRRRRCCS